jgi:hypothetical protein
LSAVPLERSIAGLEALRCEFREELVRIVECTPFPRMRPDAGARFGFTRNVSKSGLCATIDLAVEEGSLVHMRLWDPSGRVAREAIARVAWSEPLGPTRHRLGLELQISRAHGGQEPPAPTASLQVA